MATNIKRPTTSFMRWLNDHREELKKKNPGAKAKDISTLGGAEWQRLKASNTKKDQEVVKKYEDAASADKARYQKETEEHPDLIPKNKKRSTSKSTGKGKKEKDPNAPKRPLTAYILWSKDNREKIIKANPNAKGKDIIKLLSDGWKRVNESSNKKEKEEADKYEKLAEKERERYAQEKETYKEEHETKKGPKRAMTAYMLWLNAHREDFKKSHPDAKVTEISTIGGAAWKKLQASTKEIDKKEIKKYQDLAAADKARYEKEKEAVAKSQ